MEKQRSRFIYGEEWPSDNDWKNWRKTLSSKTLGYQIVDRDLGKWRHRSPRIWRSLWNEDSVSVELMADNGEVLKYKYSHARIYMRNLNHNSGAVSGVLVTVEDASEDSVEIPN